jgi:serine/threonine-protein kinase ATR
MATFQTLIGVPALSTATLASWSIFTRTLRPEDIGPHAGPTTACITYHWDNLLDDGRACATALIEYIVENGGNIWHHTDDIADLSLIPELQKAHDSLKRLRGETAPKQGLERLMRRTFTDNYFVALQSLRELKGFIIDNRQLIAKMASGDVFDPLHSQIIAVLLSVACKDGEGSEVLHDLAFECMSSLGALDPDRCEIPFKDPTMIFVNYSGEDRQTEFIKHLISDLLVGTFRSTSDVKYQNRIAFTIQELLKICGFGPALLYNAGPLPAKTRRRWESFDKRVAVTIAPLLEGRLSQDDAETLELQHPVYLYQSSYREWLQRWAEYLICHVGSNGARRLFGAFRLSVRGNDVVIAHHILPHLVANVLVTGGDKEREKIRQEMLTVLEDQVNPGSGSTQNKRLLSAQV